ncbi:MAG: response regulator [Burkholderiales bacterium]
MTAEDGLAGLQRNPRAATDLIFCDLVMPILDGYGVLAEGFRARRDGHHSVHLLSASADQASVKKRLCRGATAYPHR